MVMRTHGQFLPKSLRVSMDMSPRTFQSLPRLEKPQKHSACCRKEFVVVARACRRPSSPSRGPQHARSAACRTFGDTRTGIATKQGPQGSGATPIAPRRGPVPVQRNGGLGPPVSFPGNRHQAPRASRARWRPGSVARRTLSPPAGRRIPVSIRTRTTGYAGTRASISTRSGVRS